MAKLQKRVRLTAGRVESFTCPADKSQAFLWDTDTSTLALRASPIGRKTYVFESRLNGATLRISIGTAADWPIGQARIEAKRLKTLVDSGQDPREIERQKQSDKAAAQVAAVAQAQADRQAALTVGEIWPLYLQTGKPKRRDAWKPRYLADLKTMSAPGAIAQIMGHTPSATAEGYRPRSIDALRPYAEKIEAWILEQANVQFDRAAEPGKLRAVG